MSRAIRRVFYAVLTCCCMLPSLSYSAAWQFEPTVSMRGSYDDNVRLKSDSDEEDSVYEARLSPTLRLARYTDLTTIDGFIRLDFNRYFGDDDNFSDKNNQLVGFSATRRGERGRMGLRSTFKRDTILKSVRAPDDPEAEFGPLESEESVDDGSVQENIRRYRFDIRPNFTYDLTERWQVGMGYRYQNTYYDENDSDNDGEDDLFDFDKHTINGLVSVPITEKNKLVSTLSASRFDSDSNRTTDNFELQAGLRHDFDETTRIILTVGGRYTDFDDDRAGEDASGNTDKAGWVARLGATKSTGLTTFEGSIERKLSPSGSGDEVETNELNFRLERQLTEFMSFLFRTRLFENESIRSTRVGNNRRFLSIDPSLRWQFTESWSISTSYRYRRQKNFNEPNAASSNAVFLTLFYKPRTELGK